MAKAKELEDLDLVVKAALYQGIPKGVRQIEGTLSVKFGVQMNHKKIHRIMRKYKIYCPVRPEKPYKGMTNTVLHRTFDNAVNRNFNNGLARTILLTDITYIHYDGGNKLCYLSTIKDAATHEILAHKVSTSMSVDLVLDTIDNLVKLHHHELNTNNQIYLHSDQGSQYTSLSYQNRLEIENILCSMSRRGNCHDNAPQESFFGHMKDELFDTLLKTKRYDIVEGLLDNYMDYYNNERIQESLLKLTPSEYYNYLFTKKYPYREVLGISMKEITKE